MSFKKVFLIGVFLFFASSIKAVEFDARVGSLLPISSLFREIYGTVNPSYQLEISGDLSRRIKAWGNGAYSHIQGASVPLKTKSHLQMVPLSFGVKYFGYLTENWEFSIGLGPCYTWLCETNDSQFIPRAKTLHGLGGIGKILFARKVRGISSSVFADYLLQRASNVDLSSFIFGGGIGGYY